MLVWTERGGTRREPQGDLRSVLVLALRLLISVQGFRLLRSVTNEEELRPPAAWATNAADRSHLTSTTKPGIRPAQVLM